MSFNNVISASILFDLHEKEKAYRLKCANRIIFLDIDGVLNDKASQNDAVYLLPNLVKLVNTLTWVTDSSIVISSTWRKGPDAWKYIRYAFSIFGFDSTFNKNQLPYGDYEKSRVDYISEYIDEHRIIDFAIIDDTDYRWERKGLRDFVVQTNPRLGITYADYDRVLELFNIKPYKNKFDDDF